MGFPDPVEREVGLAAVRIEAGTVYSQLSTKAQAITDEELAPLKDFVDNASGGEGAEAAVAQIDKLAKKVLNDLAASMGTGVLTGLAAVLFGLVTFVVGASQDAGAWVARGWLAGGSVYAFTNRVVHYGSQGTEKAWIYSTDWASSLGRQTDRVMQPARQMQKQLWQAATGGAWVEDTFTAQARSRVQGIVWLAWALVGLGLFMGALGAGQVLVEWLKGMSSQSGLPESVI